MSRRVIITKRKLLIISLSIPYTIINHALVKKVSMIDKPYRVWGMSLPPSPLCKNSHYTLVPCVLLNCSHQDFPPFN